MVNSLPEGIISMCPNENRIITMIIIAIIATIGVVINIVTVRMLLDHCHYYII